MYQFLVAFKVTANYRSKGAKTSDIYYKELAASQQQSKKIINYKRFCLERSNYPHMNGETLSQK